ncbi:MAG: hypothetical protein QG622_1936 [Actinomycetota bacterium]|nr:hypothetical protein [Actinomycetota bacterium]
MDEDENLVGKGVRTKLRNAARPVLPLGSGEVRESLEVRANPGEGLGILGPAPRRPPWAEDPEPVRHPVGLTEQVR